VQFVPLALLILFHALVVVRNTIHRWRTGKSGNFTHRARTRNERLRNLGFRVVLLVAWVQTFRAAAGHLELAPTPFLRALGTALGLCGALLMFAAQLELGDSWRIGIEEGARPGLVVRGMYRWSRNPIFLWILVSWIGLALLLFDLLFGVLVVLMVLGIRAQVRDEERWLLETYGEAYRDYAARVGRFLPGIGRLAAGPKPGAS
jgi:protein-S-isoprenylcysteine O-methyltransferase Ste14